MARIRQSMTLDDLPAYVWLVLVGAVIGHAGWQVARALWRQIRSRRRRLELERADQALRTFADTYSPDVELNERGHMTFTRDIAAGEVFMVPLHMLQTHRRNGGP